MTKNKVKIIEVGPRDGLQNETKVLSIEDKARFLELLVDAGISYVEATSFVRADKIPQMADAKGLFKLTYPLLDKAQLTCLVPNLRGLEDAISVGVKDIAIFTAASETFNQKNINASIEESFKRFEPVVSKAKELGIRIRGYTSTAFGCPYEGKIDPARVMKVVERLFKLGCYEVSIGDTIGVATPDQSFVITEKLIKNFSKEKIAMHFHDTRHMAVANAYAAFQAGAQNFDSSAGGLGGCPYAVGSKGNVATEKMVYLFESMGISTGIDLKKLTDASKFIYGKLDRVGHDREFSVFKK